MFYAVESNAAGSLLSITAELLRPAGELFDGDVCQIAILRELQRLYDELVENESVCRLDKFVATEKTSRSKWLWSRLTQQSSSSPVKGFYLYGGVGTGKTMLMDLFYEQLPSNWRKKGIHFHDFMLGVHSHLQKHKGVANPLEVVAGEISDESILLCHDEFMIKSSLDTIAFRSSLYSCFLASLVILAPSSSSGLVQRSETVAFHLGYLSMALRREKERESWRRRGKIARFACPACIWTFLEKKKRGLDALNHFNPIIS
ncbi:LOW QUALITY PROTEIN: cell division protein ZapE-like [Impatiens glandulifera]|uniref:LOW QUALITY PROTEIN: cell division protein ZapE-like n=1 Tax=Impatiens glandulifera TaxID=253017 RepID=UPI001FB08B74|nr:LOW QUALITY PROTEIN: cell division protein ZapE-like [Impatiens glandulifera]